jgi:mannitol-1-phosphate/altronate dehydrogenase
MANIVIIGAGAVGRGLLGKLFIESDHNVTFIESDRALWHALNRQSFYPCKDVHGAVHLVGPYNAVLAERGDARVAVQEADAVFVAVRNESLRDVYAWLAKTTLDKPIPVFLCANAKNPVLVARDVCKNSNYQFHHAIAETVNPVPDPFLLARESLFVYSDPAGYLLIPQMTLPFVSAGLVMTIEFDYAWQKKWILHCALHAVAALNGLRSGKVNIRDAITAEIEEMFANAAEEIDRRFQRTGNEARARLLCELTAMRDATNIDTCRRVARDARRKAGEGERLWDLRELLNGDSRITDLMAYALKLDL